MRKIKSEAKKWIVGCVGCLLIGTSIANALPFYYCGVKSYVYGSVTCGTGHGYGGSIVCSGMCYWITQERGCVFITDPDFSCSSSSCSGTTIVPLSYCHANSENTACICY